MKQINFENLEECIECYGRGNLVAVCTLSQIIFYVKHGCQPKFVWENENAPGKITCWFLKSESQYVYKRWMENNPAKGDRN